MVIRVRIWSQISLMSTIMFFPLKYLVVQGILLIFIIKDCPELINYWSEEK